MGFLQTIALFLLVGSLVTVGLLVLRRSLLNRAMHRRSELTARLRPPAIAFVSSAADTDTPVYRGREAAVFAELLAVYARALRGRARERIAVYFEASGGVDHELAALASRRAWRRAAAAFTLGDMCSQRAVPALLEALDDRARDVRMAAARSLGRLGAVDAAEPLIASTLDGRLPRDVAGLTLFDLGPTAVPRLLELSSDVEPAMRAGAIELIGLLGGAGDAPPLIERLRDPSAAVRAAGADALGGLGAGEARDALVRALDDRSPPVRAAAARALGRTGGRQAVEALIRIARSDRFEPAQAAAEALARIDPRRLLEAAAEPDAGPHLHEAADMVAL
jgi:HEAT repeat protein